jgi:hypothetical protein
VFLFANFNICDSCRFISIDVFFSLWVKFPNFYACLVIFDWIANIVNSLWLGVGYRGISINLFLGEVKLCVN